MFLPTSAGSIGANDWQQVQGAAGSAGAAGAPAAAGRGRISASGFSTDVPPADGGGGGGARAAAAAAAGASAMVRAASTQAFSKVGASNDDGLDGGGGEEAEAETRLGLGLALGDVDDSLLSGGGGGGDMAAQRSAAGTPAPVMMQTTADTPGPEADMVGGAGSTYAACLCGPWRLDV